MGPLWGPPWGRHGARSLWGRHGASRGLAKNRANIVPGKNRANPRARRAALYVVQPGKLRENLPERIMPRKNLLAFKANDGYCGEFI
jgi:hypothetical protein